MRFYILTDHGVPNEVTSSRDKRDKWLEAHDAREVVECDTDQIFNKYSQSHVDFLKKESKKNFDEFKRYQEQNEKLDYEKRYWKQLYELCKHEKDKLDRIVVELEGKIDKEELQSDAYLKGYKDGTAAVFEIWDRVRAK